MRPHKTITFPSASGGEEITLPSAKVMQLHKAICDLFQTSTLDEILHDISFIYDSYMKGLIANGGIGNRPGDGRYFNKHMLEMLLYQLYEFYLSTKSECHD